jgi:hypothetical protein
VSSSHFIGLSASFYLFNFLKKEEEEKSNVFMCFWSKKENKRKEKKVIEFLFPVRF